MNRDQLRRLLSVDGRQLIHVPPSESGLERDILTTGNVTSNEITALAGCQDFAIVLEIEHTGSTPSGGDVDVGVATFTTGDGDVISPMFAVEMQVLTAAAFSSRRLAGFSWHNGTQTIINTCIAKAESRLLPFASSLTLKMSVITAVTGPTTATVKCHIFGIR